jgi:hypothetical protein
VLHDGRVQLLVGIGVVLFTQDEPLGLAQRLQCLRKPSGDRG